jgi:hypothetical protein
MTATPIKPCRAAGRAFTLAELLVAFALMAVLMVATAATLALATRALPDANDPSQRVMTSAKVLGNLAEELRSAQYITEQTATAVTFVAPDRNGDGAPEVVRYAWSGTPGDPLTRRANGGAVHTALANVQQFALGYVTATRSINFAGPRVTSDKLQLFVNSSSSGLRTDYVDRSHWWGQTFRATLPPQALSWSVEDVYLRGRQAGLLLGSTTIQLYPAGADLKPASPLLGQQTELELNLPLLTGPFTWRMFSFANITGLAPDQGLSVLITTNDLDPSWQFEYNDSGVAFANAGMLDSGGAGNSWNVSTNKALRLMVYGRYVTTSGDQTLTRSCVSAVTVSLIAGDSADATALEQKVSMLNQPPVVTAAWEADFSCDPTALDFDMDGSADWAVHNAASFTAASLSGGVWTVPAYTLRTNTALNFNTPVTVEARLRDTTTTGTGAGVLAYVDRGVTTALVFFEVMLQSDGTQTVTLNYMTDAVTLINMATITGVPAGFIDARVIIDPATKQANLWLNGQDRGTYAYQKLPFSMPPYVELYRANNDDGAQFDRVRVLVGGTVTNATGS